MSRKEMTKKVSPYSVHPSVSQGQAMVRNLAETTGKPLEEWTRILNNAGPSEQKEQYLWLRTEHGLGSTTARLIADAAYGRNLENIDPGVYLAMAETYVERMYRSPKNGLKPLHEVLVSLARGLGEDVKVCPCKTIVPLYRRHVFAHIKPASRTRIDLGLALKDYRYPPPASLIDTGGMARGDRITHRLPLGDLSDINSEVKRWLRIAYDLDA